MSGFDIGRKHVGDGAPCFVIAEVGLAHDGSVRVAHEFIDAIASTGADAVKFQCHLGDETDEWRIKPRWKAESREEYWKRTAFDFDEWQALKHHANLEGFEFLCSPFSVEAVRMLDPLVPAWKVPSGMLSDIPLWLAIAKTRKPVLLSTGMATKEEIDLAEERAKLEDLEYLLLHCTSIYPCPPEAMVLGNFHEDGLSDHSGTIYAGLAAVTLGCDVLEVHVKLYDWDGGPDASSSLTVAKLKELVEGIRWIEKAKANPVDKDAMAKELAPMRAMFMRQRRRRPPRDWRDGSVVPKRAEET